MRTCARKFRRGRPSARYKAARNGPASEKERRFGAFSLPRFRPFPSPVLLSARPRSDRCLDRASDSCPLPTYMQPDPDSVGQHPTCDRSRFPAVRLPRRRFGDARSATVRPRLLIVDLGMPDPLSLDRESDADARPNRIPRSTGAVRSDPPDPDLRLIIINFKLIIKLISKLFFQIFSMIAFIVAITMIYSVR